jgi:myo-inositol-1(or 4)-monophosphatase
MKNTAKLYRGVRRPGSAALDLCYVARGTFDLYFERGLSPWDSAAGALIVSEAGGVCQTYRGKYYTPFHNSLAAGSLTAVKEFVTKVEGLIGPDVD